MVWPRTKPTGSTVTLASMVTLGSTIALLVLFLGRAPSCAAAPELLSLEPKTATVAPKGLLQFTVDSTLPNRVLRWRSDGGTIDQSGRLRAPADPGRVVVTVSDGQRYGWATIQVVDADLPRPPREISLPADFDFSFRRKVMDVQGFRTSSDGHRCLLEAMISVHHPAARQFELWVGTHYHRWRRLLRRPVAGRGLLRIRHRFNRRRVRTFWLELLDRRGDVLAATKRSFPSSGK